MSKEKLRISMHAFHTPNIQFATTFYTSPYLIQGDFPRGVVILSYVHTKAIYNYQNKRLDRHELIVTTSKDELDLLTSGSSQNISISIEKSYFYNAFEKYFGISFDEIAKRKRLKLMPEKTDRFVEEMNAWLHFFLQGGSLNFTLHEYEHMESEIMQSLFRFVVMEEHRDKLSKSTIQKVRTILHENLTSNLLMDDLANDLNTNMRNIQRLFKNNMGLSPKSYLQYLRLHEARKELLATGKETATIQNLARKYNFFHMGYFTSEYKKLFGETPSQTSNRHRS
jgi:AraC-like DNA-binding protein